MATCGIYKFENLINGKIYIGQSIDIERRYREHKSMNKDSTFMDAVKKYGFENFKFDIIEECDQSKLNEKEIFWIKYYNSKVPNGYNRDNGGGSGWNKNFENDIKIKVTKYDLDGNFIKGYVSISEAERENGIAAKASNISKVCKGEAYESNGFQWRYAVGNYTQNIGVAL